MYASRSQSVSSRSTASTQLAPATTASVHRVYTWDDVFDKKKHDFEVFCILLASLFRFSTHML
jgi:hypothetical protein